MEKVLLEDGQAHLMVACTTVENKYVYFILCETAPNVTTSKYKKIPPQDESYKLCKKCGNIIAKEFAEEE